MRRESLRAFAENPVSGPTPGDLEIITANPGVGRRDQHRQPDQTVGAR